MHVEPLIRVVEDQHLRSPCQGPLGSGGPIGIGDHLCLGHGMLVHQGLVTPVAAEQNARHQAARYVMTGDPDGYRRFAGAADGEIAYGDGRQWQVVHRQPAAAVGQLPCRHGAAPKAGGGQQCQAYQPRVRPPAGPEPPHYPMSVAPSRHGSVLDTSSRPFAARANPSAKPASPSATSNGRP